MNSNTYCLFYKTVRKEVFLCWSKQKFILFLFFSFFITGFIYFWATSFFKILYFHLGNATFVGIAWKFHVYFIIDFVCNHVFLRWNPITMNGSLKYYFETWLCCCKKSIHALILYIFVFLIKTWKSVLVACNTVNRLQFCWNKSMIFISRSKSNNHDLEMIP